MLTVDGSRHNTFMGKEGIELADINPKCVYDFFRFSSRIRAFGRDVSLARMANVINAVS